jgi:hypothetical protein
MVRIKHHIMGISREDATAMIVHASPVGELFKPTN